MADDFTKAKPGTRLYSTAHGWGVVRELYTSGRYPLQMEFSFIAAENFTKTGQLYDYPDAPQVLFWDDPKIVPPPRPRTKVKRWIKTFYDKNGRVFIAGNGMHPMIFKTKYEAENHFPQGNEAFICEIEVYEDTLD